MKFARAKTLGEIARNAGLKAPEGESEHLEITGVNTVDNAELGDIVWAETKQALDLLSDTSAAAAIVSPDVPELPLPCVRHPLPKYIFGSLLQEFLPTDEGDPVTNSIASDVTIDPAAKICGDVAIGARTRVLAGAVVGKGCRISEDCVVGYNVVLNWGVELGNRVTVHSGSIIGTDGFGYVQKPTDEDASVWESLKIPHVGKVLIEDDVEIGAGVCIDRGLLQSTVIGKGTKIDNLVQIGHNCQIGPHNILVGQAGLSGSVTTGKNVIIAGQAGVADHAKIGDRAILMAGTKVLGEIPPDGKMMGYPALPRSDYWKWISALMDVTHIKRILKAAAEAESFDEFKKKISELKPLRWPMKK